MHGQSPYGNFPVEGALKACGPADRDGEIRERIQTNGRCEAANPNGDTYGPVVVRSPTSPGTRSSAGAGSGTTCPRRTSRRSCSTCCACSGSASSGGDSAGTGSAVTLAFAWAAYPFTQYVSSSNTNDAIMPAFLIWGFWLVHLRLGARRVRRARGVDEVRGAPGRAAVGDLPGVQGLETAGADLRRRLRRWRRSRASGSCCSSRARFHAAASSGTGRSRTQIDRRLAVLALGLAASTTPGCPTSRGCRRSSRCCSSPARGAVAFLPRRKSPLQLAALTGAILIGFELVLTHWFYLYLPWFFRVRRLRRAPPAEPSRRNGEGRRAR